MPATRNPAKTLIAFDPDGGEHTRRTGARYDWAGLVQRYHGGPWVQVAKGWSYDSVNSRTWTASAGCHDVEVTRFYQSGTNRAVEARTAARARRLAVEQEQAAKNGNQRYAPATVAQAGLARLGRWCADADFPGHVKTGDELIGSDRYWRAAYETRVAALRESETAAGRAPHQWVSPVSGIGCSCDAETVRHPPHRVAGTI